jgi:hypothetical protein
MERAVDLASHKTLGYTSFQWLSIDDQPLSPPPSSFGGFSPNLRFGLFFAIAGTWL